MPTPQQQINYGNVPNDGQGDALRTAFVKVDDNFDAIWNAGPVGSNVTIINSTISTVNTNGNLVLKPNGIGIVQVNSSAVPDLANIRDLGTADRRWRRIYLQSFNTANLEVQGDLSVSGNLTIQGDTIQIGNLITDARTLQLANTAITPEQANGAGITVGANDDTATLLYDSDSNAWVTNIGITTAANITADYFLGNGSQLTGLPEGYGNTDVELLMDSGVAANIIPAANAVYSLGNATNYWSNLWVSNNTIYIGGVPLGVTGNVLTVNGEPVLQNDSDSSITTTGDITANSFIGDGSQLTGLPEQYSNANVVTLLAAFGSNTITTTGNITANSFIGDGSQLTGLPASYSDANVAAYLPTYAGNILVDRVIGNTTHNSGYLQWQGNSSGDLNGYTTLRLVPDDTLVENDQYLIIDPTAPSHIHIRAGGTQDSSAAELFLGGEVNYVRVTDGSGVRLQNQTRNDTTYYYSDPGTFTNGSWYESGGTYFVQYTTADSELIDVSFQFNDDNENTLLVYYDAGNDSAELTSAGSVSNLGGGVYRVSVNQAPPASPTVITAFEYTIWNTRTNSVELSSNDFRISVTDDIRITGSDVFSLRNESPNEPIEIITDYDGAERTWEFGATGTLTTPGDIVVAGDITGTSGASTLVLKAEPNSNTAIQLNDSVDSEIRTVANLEIRTDSSNTDQIWTFDTNGNLTVPDSSVITASAGYITIGSGDGSGLLVGAGGALFNADNSNFVIYGNLSDPGASITIPSNANAGNGQPLMIESLQSNVAITAGGNTWTFENNSNLTVAGNINFNGDASAAPSLNDFASITSAANFAVVIDSADSAAAWSFESGDGALGEFDESPVFRTPAGNGSVIYNETQLAMLAGNIDAGERSSVRLEDGGVALLGTTSLGGELSTIIFEVNTGGVGIRALGDAAPRLNVVGNITGGNINTGGQISATGNLSANNVSTGNVVATRLQNDANLVLRSNVAGTLRNWTFDVLGDLNLPFGGNIVGSGGVIANTGTFTGNVTAANFEGNISITGNITGTSANVDLVAGSFTSTFDNTGNVALPGNVSAAGDVTATGDVTGKVLISTNSVGNEGGEIQLAASANATITNGVIIDSYNDIVRIFEGGGTARGVQIDLAKAPPSVGGELLWKVSDLVDAGTFVTLDNLKATVPTTGNRGLSIATVSGSFTANFGGWYGASLGTGGSSVNNISVTTTESGSLFGWNFVAEGDTAQYTIFDKTNTRMYRVTLMIGPAYLDNFISIERLA